MCGRVYVRSTLADMVSRFSFAEPSEVGAIGNTFPRYNGAPSQGYPIITLDELAMARRCLSPAAGDS